MIETILYNGNIITLNDNQPHASALAIVFGRIVAVGSDEDILALTNAHTKKINLNGKTVIPGLTDAHIHWEWTARALRSVDLFEVPSKQIALERVAERAQKTPKGAWITGWGWTQDVWADRKFPSAKDLDFVTTDHPAYFSAKSGHAGWVNSVALRQCGITADTPNPGGGEIVKDADGQPTGLLFETAMNLVNDKIPSPTVDELADMMVEAQDAALATGLTGFHDFDNPSCLSALQRLRERGQLKMRAVKNINKDWLNHALESGIRWGFGDDWIRIGGLKMFADGALGPRTAYMIEPYEGEPDNYGIAVLDQEEMQEHVLQATRAGLPSTIHAIGDRAVHEVLNVYEVARQEEAKSRIPHTTRRHRIEHVQVIHPKDVSRFAKLNIIASMQPIHATSDYQMSDSYWGYRSQWAYNPRIQIDQGVVVAFGSDSPVDPFHPIRGIHAAVTRQRPDGSPGKDGWYPKAKVTVDEALRGYTINNAYTAGMEDRLGKLARGYLADLVVIDRDLTKFPGTEILETQVLATMVGGIFRYGGVE